MSFAHTNKPFFQKKRLAALWLIAVISLITMVANRPLWSEPSPVHDALEIAGVLLVLTGILGRLWSILYIGSKKNGELVTSGPYSMTRNPLYFFSMVAIVGIGVNYGSVLLACLLLVSTIMVFRYTAKRESAYLRQLFGPAYDKYEQAVPMFLPNPLLYRDVDDVTFSSAALGRTFRDVLFFILLLPTLELVDFLHLSGYLKSVFVLP
ncbi:methyltransferase family protein [Rhizobium sp.]|jgi:protein-S-isoprenylcysteine O-methyltransferase Ste14|uniref:methyltransferase family protein n=1 Tax=Rhizobium sp. TaxID=391 RepID=UPI002897AF49